MNEPSNTQLHTMIPVRSTTCERISVIHTAQPTSSERKIYYYSGTYIKSEPSLPSPILLSPVASYHTIRVTPSQVLRRGPFGDEAGDDDDEDGDSDEDSSSS